MFGVPKEVVVKKRSVALVFSNEEEAEAAYSAWKGHADNLLITCYGAFYNALVIPKIIVAEVVNDG